VIGRKRWEAAIALLIWLFIPLCDCKGGSAGPPSLVFGRVCAGQLLMAKTRNRI
jgi:hypothetical protein